MSAAFSSRLRFAPSPTGLLHLGGLRTALYNYLYARHTNGKFIVRFEDTDAARNIKNGETAILQSLRAIGLTIDETIDTAKTQFGPYRQSERLSLYQERAQQLIDANQAYRCFCTTEQIQASRVSQKNAGVKAIAYDRRCRDLPPEEVNQLLAAQTAFCVRLRVPESTDVTYDDLVYGPVSFATNNIDDFVLLKTTTGPTFNFANAIDDHEMAITHVFRGSDHVSNTPKQILVFRAFQWTVPQYAHLTLIKSNTATKISKRNFVAENFLQHYIDAGYLPVAIANYLALLGWTPPNNEEVLTMTQMIDRFDGRQLNKAESQFSLAKLNWINAQHLNQLSATEYLQLARPFLQPIARDQKCLLTDLEPLAQSVRPLIACFADLTKELAVYWQPMPLVYSADGALLIKTESALVQTFVDELTDLSEWTTETINSALFRVQGKSALTKKKTFSLLRLLLTNQKHGPRLRTMIYLFGQQKTIAIATTALAVHK